MGNRYREIMFLEVPNEPIKATRDWIKIRGTINDWPTEEEVREIIQGNCQFINETTLHEDFMETEIRYKYSHLNNRFGRFLEIVSAYKLAGWEYYNIRKYPSSPPPGNTLYSYFLTK